MPSEMTCDECGRHMDHCVCGAPVCKSCGNPWVEHDGCEMLCNRVQELEKRVADLEAGFNPRSNPAPGPMVELTRDMVDRMMDTDPRMGRTNRA